MDEVCEVVLTGPDATWLADFTRSLVDERLAACGQNVSEIRSIYRWQGEIHDDVEARVMLHTRRSLVSQITARITAEHPYDVACVLALPVVDGNTAYLQWVLNETREA